MTRLLDVSASLISGVGDLAIQRHQDLPTDFLDHLKAERDASSHAPAGEFHRACSVPVAIHESWLRAGYDMTQEPARKTLARLRAEGLDVFITTNKTL